MNNNTKEQAKEIANALEEQRKKIARDIHDGPAQTMANVVLRLEYLEKLLDKDKNLVKEEINDLKDLVRKCLSEIRDFIFDLRPMALDDLGLIPTVKRVLQNFQERYKISTNFLILGEEKRLEQTKEITLFRIIQEALNNVIKHSQAKEVKITLELDEKHAIVNVKDNGVGFDYESFFKKAFPDKLGLVSMRERAELLNGVFSIKSSPGNGCSITVRIPL